MNDLETMLRASLQERADDVEPTPELWQQVQRRVARRLAMPLLVWTAAGVAAVVTAVAVVPGLMDGVQDRLDIQPVGSETPTGEVPEGPVAAAPLTHYVAVVDGRLVLRGVDGSESVLWESTEGGARTLAVRPGSTSAGFSIAAVAGIEGMLDLVVVTVTPSGTAVRQTFLGPDTEDAAPMPVPAWSPDGTTVATTVTTDDGPELVMVEVDATTADGGMPLSRLALVGESEAARLRLQDCAVSAGTCDRLRLQDWSGDPNGGRLAFTSEGLVLEAGITATADGWQLDGPLVETAPDDYVIDVATHPDGRLYRLLAGQGAGSGDAEDAGLGLFLDEEPLGYPDLATADPSGVWMTAVDGGVFVGLGSEARQINVGEGRATMLAVPGVSYAAWIPVAGEAAEPAPTAVPTATDAPRADGPLDASGVTPYVAIDELGRLAVHTGAGEREVIVDEQLWSPEAGVRVMDVSVRPDSSPGELSGMLLLATEGGPELHWFRAAAGATSTRRMEGPFGLGEGDTEQRDAPTWSPDGRHIAWVEPDGAGGWTLRSVGMADDGPTDEDAGFGLDVDADRLRLTGWVWDEVDGMTTRGSLSLLDHDGGDWHVTVERQGDGALAVGSTFAWPDAERPPGVVVDRGIRGDTWVELFVDGDAVELWYRAPVRIPFSGMADPRDLDLDVLEQVSIVTNRATGEAFVVDIAGGVAPLEADAATTHGFDPVR